jgi:hypothetical protein
MCLQAELHLLVGEREAPELYAAEPGAPMEVGVTLEYVTRG